ncbi:sulfotransferase family protein [Sinimarinibacterium flocculans]|uniref:sulfotransferase family protein n=1 Tax=Sinimarinibacterium flocculans TaxID=985250 RepID=UPI00248FAA0B|nr:sulfotransferase [Sinimarinibacterium flocculans]
MTQHTPPPVRFDPETLLAEAQAKTGLSDFGEPSFREGLRVFCAALESDAQLSDFGRGLLHQKVMELLTNRLGIEDWYRRHPEIGDEVLAPPVVIVGLPRTGTTLLQRLLSQDPQFYSMPWWESRYPVPFPDESLAAPTQRIEQARAEVKVMVEAMPKLLSIHPMDADQADEEVMLMEHAFIAAMNTYACIPSYMDWLAQADERPAYAYLKRMLKFLQWQKRQRGIRAERWVLKAPHHLLRIHLVLELFPGAKIIQTHRDPVDTIPSIASFLDTLWRIYSNDVDPTAAGREWSALMARAFRHVMTVRDENPAPFFDVDFLDTVKKPLDTARAIYAWAGLTLTPEAEAAMQRWLDANVRDARAAHEYDTSQFGLTPEQLRQQFAEYRQRHIV